MRIAQVAPLGESVPPRKYGGTERIVSYLTEAFVQMGHEVTLYASGDSKTAARLRSVSLRSLRGHAEHGNLDLIFRQVMADVHAARHGFDIIHFHVGWYEFPVFERSRSLCLTTLHGPLEPPGVQERIGAYPDFPLVSISNAQRAPLPRQNWVDTIYHGIPDPGVALKGGRSYLAFLGRISPEKRPDLAIEIARRTGWPIKIAAKVDPVNQEYFEQAIRPLLAQPGVAFVGELDEAAKQSFLADAHALLFPIDWPEPFGLVMVEAFACGTPVIAYRRGSVPEIVEDGLTGFVVEDVAGAVAAIARLPQLDRGAIQARFRERFTVARMVRDYLSLYERLIERPPAPQVQATSH